MSRFWKREKKGFKFSIFQFSALMFHQNLKNTVLKWKTVNEDLKRIPFLKEDTKQVPTPKINLLCKGLIG